VKPTPSLTAEDAVVARAAGPGVLVLCFLLLLIVVVVVVYFATTVQLPL